MKISRRLRDLIIVSIDEKGDGILRSIDAEFRSGHISHESWDIMHRVAINQIERMKNAVISDIDIYRGKRFKSRQARVHKCCWCSNPKLPDSKYCSACSTYHEG